ncbi:hypothetical protein P7K49_022941 [Saguinus oedipus]|uniref:Uncharacterized protein n=1 Tax=Saguinus oedipus TaxID=9490 RepID=A0ABQ9UK74_SAGOE|nr:hypothetical protein P7K49_022941 [Saguinus oedipus]
MLPRAGPQSAGLPDRIARPFGRCQKDLPADAVRSDDPEDPSPNRPRLPGPKTGLGPAQSSSSWGPTTAPLPALPRALPRPPGGGALAAPGHAPEFASVHPAAGTRSSLPDPGPLRMPASRAQPAAKTRPGPKLRLPEPEQRTATY